VTPAPRPDGDGDGNGAIDVWTISRTGCKCYFDQKRTDCACCKNGGCQCTAQFPNQCVACGYGCLCGQKPILLHRSLFQAATSLFSQAVFGLDVWTTSKVGCQCYFDAKRRDCACCRNGGCQCAADNPHQCVQCGYGCLCGQKPISLDRSIFKFTGKIIDGGLNIFGGGLNIIKEGIETIGGRGQGGRGQGGHGGFFGQGRVIGVHVEGDKDGHGQGQGQGSRGRFHFGLDTSHLNDDKNGKKDSHDRYHFGLDTSHLNDDKNGKKDSHDRFHFGLDTSHLKDDKNDGSFSGLRLKSKEVQKLQ